MPTIRDLHDAHRAEPFPLPADAEVAGVALVLLEADVASLAERHLADDGALRRDQWFALRAAADDLRAVLPHLTGAAWVYFARLFALAQAMLRTAPTDASRGPAAG